MNNPRLQLSGVPPSSHCSWSAAQASRGPLAAGHLSWNRAGSTRGRSYSRGDSRPSIEWDHPALPKPAASSLWIDRGERGRRYSVRSIPLPHRQPNESARATAEPPDRKTESTADSCPLPLFDEDRWELRGSPWSDQTTDS